MPRFWSSPQTIDAFRLSIVSVVFTAAAGIGGCVAFGMTGSSLILCYGLENLVDFLSSIVVLWRFYLPHKDPDREALLMRREKRASVAISFILALLGLAVLIAALEDFAHQETKANLRIISIVSIVSFIIFGCMTIVKFHMGKKLQSASLKKDAVCSLIGTILSGSLFVNTLIIMGQAKAWWLDPFVAFSCAIGSLIYGLSSIYRAYVVQGIPVGNPSWWLMSQGDGMDEITGRDINDDDLRMGVEIASNNKSQDDDPDSEAAPQSADTDAGEENAVQDADESKKDENVKGDGDNEGSDEKPETEIV